jgi:hypothetical protein
VVNLWKEQKNDNYAQVFNPSNDLLVTVTKEIDVILTKKRGGLAHEAVCHTKLL